MNGFGDHRIEGIGDKHVPWVHNVRNTDAVAAIDDEDCMRILRLFNEPAGQAYLAGLGVDAATITRLKFNCALVDEHPSNHAEPAEFAKGWIAIPSGGPKSPSTKPASWCEHSSEPRLASVPGNG